MLKKISFILTIVVLSMALAGQFMTNEFEVEQSVDITAQTPFIHQYVNDLKQWPRWSPWQEDRSAMRIIYGKVTSGVGASQSWQGAEGSGRLNVTASSVENGIAYDVYFETDTTPSISALEYHPLNNQSTRVTWRLHGEIEMPVIGGYIALFIENRTSAMFQTGLYNLKLLVEKDHADAN